MLIYILRGVFCFAFFHHTALLMSMKAKHISLTLRASKVPKSHEHWRMLSIGLMCAEMTGGTLPLQPCCCFPNCPWFLLREMLKTGASSLTPFCWYLYSVGQEERHHPRLAVPTPYTTQPSLACFLSPLTLVPPPSWKLSLG